MNKNLFIFANENRISKNAQIQLKTQLKDLGYKIQDKLTDDTHLIICVGGDGTFLDLLNQHKFPEIPIIGVNAGHLGFFQEFEEKDLASFLKEYEKGNYRTQILNPVKAIIKTETESFTRYGINEIVIKTAGQYPIHLNVSINNEPIENFSGDGLLVATSTGSTAYNYSLGGGIVDPRLKLLQVTPIAPMNSTAYRSFTSSIILPDKMDFTIRPVLRKGKENVSLCYDGMIENYSDIKEISIRLSNREIKLIRSGDYDFWGKVKSKFL